MLPRSVAPAASPRRINLETKNPNRLWAASLEETQRVQELTQISNRRTEKVKELKECFGID